MEAKSAKRLVQIKAGMHNVIVIFLRTEKHGLAKQDTEKHGSHGWRVPSSNQRAKPQRNRGYIGIIFTCIKWETEKTDRERRLKREMIGRVTQKHG